LHLLISYFFKKIMVKVSLQRLFQKKIYALFFGTERVLTILSTISVVPEQMNQ
jgi:hypothetical protein